MIIYIKTYIYQTLICALRTRISLLAGGLRHLPHPPPTTGFASFCQLMVVEGCFRNSSKRWRPMAGGWLG